MTARIVRWCCGAALVTLPWVGVGLLKLLSGRDLGAGLQPSWLLLAVATLAALPRAPGALHRVPRRALLLGAAGATALALSVMGLWIAPPPVALGEALLRYFKQVVQLLVMLAFLAWPALALRTDEVWRWTARMLVAGALLQAAYGALQWGHWYHPGPLLPALETVFTSNPAILSGSSQLHIADGFLDVPRLRGTACEPLYLGNYLLLALPMAWLTGWGRRAQAVVSGVLVLLLILTWSRGAWLAAVGGVGVAGLVAVAGGYRLRRPSWAAVVAVGAGLGAAALLLGPERMLLPAERLQQAFSSQDWSNLTRLYSMQAGWRAFLLSPVVGIGWGQFGWHFAVLVDAAGLQSQFQWPVVNSFPLQVLCETGAAGLAVLLAIAASMGTAVLRGIREGADTAAVRRLGLVAAGTAAVWLQLLTFSQYNLPHIWLAPGLLLAALADCGPKEPA